MSLNVRKIDYRITFDPCFINKDGGSLEAIFNIIVGVTLKDGREFKDLKVDWEPYTIVNQTKNEGFTVAELNEIENMINGCSEDLKKGIWLTVDKLSEKIKKN